MDRSYSVVMLLTLLAALGWLVGQQRRGRQDALDLGVLALLAGVIGARVGHVLANWAYYGERLTAILDLRDGGLSWHGGLLAGLAAVALAAAFQRTDAPPYPLRVQEMLALLAVPLAIGLLGGWLACLLTGCAYGLALPPPQRFYTFDWPDSYGVLAYRLPSQLLGMALALLLLFARPLRRRPALFLMALAAGTFLIAWTRGDLPVSWGPLRATQWIDVGLILVGAALAIAGQQARRRAR